MRSGNIGPDRRRAADARPAAALVHRLLHLHEVVRAAARGVPLPGRDAPRALPGRRRDHAGDARATSSTSCATRSSRRSSASPAASSTRTRWRGAWRCSRQAEDDLVRGAGVGAAPARRRSTPTSAGSTTSARSSPPSAAPRTPSRTTASCARRSRRAIAAGEGPMTPDGPIGRGALPPGRRGAAELDAASTTSGGCSAARARWSVVEHLHPGRRPLRRRLPPRPGATRSRALADYCLGCYTNLGLPSRVDLLERYDPRLRGRRLPHQQRQVLQLVQRRAAADAARAREAHRRAGRVHRVVRSWCTASWSAGACSPGLGTIPGACGPSTGWSRGLVMSACDVSGHR